MRLLLSLILMVGWSLGHAQSLAVTRGAGKSVKLDLGVGVTLNKESSLAREWIIINDPALPLQIESAQANPTYLPDRMRSEYRYSADYVLTTQAVGIKAYEIRFLILDVFGERQRLLSDSEVIDVAANGRRTNNSQWRLYSGADAATAFYSIAYIAAVRTDSGQILRTNPERVLAEIRKISSAITASDIEREKPATTP